MDFHLNAWSWNNLKTKTFSSTGADAVNYLHLNVLYIYLALEFLTLLRTSVVTNIIRIVYINN